MCACVRVVRVCLGHTHQCLVDSRGAGAQTPAGYESKKLTTVQSLPPWGFLFRPGHIRFQLSSQGASAGWVPLPCSRPLVQPPHGHVCTVGLCGTVAPEATISQKAPTPRHLAMVASPEQSREVPLGGERSGVQRSRDGHSRLLSEFTGHHGQTLELVFWLVTVSWSIADRWCPRGFLSMARVPEGQSRLVVK